jgi:hypothetical protein
MSFLRSTTGAISEGSVNATSDQLYLGSEADLRINYRPFSDLGLSLTGGFFFPNNYTAESAIAPGSSAVQIAGRFELSFSY